MIRTPCLLSGSAPDPERLIGIHTRRILSEFWRLKVLRDSRTERSPRGIRKESGWDQSLEENLSLESIPQFKKLNVSIWKFQRILLSNKLLRSYRSQISRDRLTTQDVLLICARLICSPRQWVEQPMYYTDTCAYTLCAYLIPQYAYASFNWIAQPMISASGGYLLEIIQWNPLSGYCSVDVTQWLWFSQSNSQMSCTFE